MVITNNYGALVWVLLKSMKNGYAILEMTVQISSWSILLKTIPTNAVTLWLSLFQKRQLTGKWMSTMAGSL